MKFILLSASNKKKKKIQEEELLNDIGSYTENLAHQAVALFESIKRISKYGLVGSMAWGVGFEV